MSDSFTDIPDYPVHLDADLFRQIQEAIAMRMHIIKMIDDGEITGGKRIGKLEALVKARLEEDERFAAEVEIVASGVRAVLRIRSVGEKYGLQRPIGGGYW